MLTLTACGGSIEYGDSRTTPCVAVEEIDQQKIIPVDSPESFLPEARASFVRVDGLCADDQVTPLPWYWCHVGWFELGGPCPLTFPDGGSVTPDAGAPRKHRRPCPHNRVNDGSCDNDQSTELPIPIKYRDILGGI